MKIAIRGHASRGKEVIQILESLGGKNKWFHYGNNENCFYELHDDCIWCATTRSEYFKYYTLEEFEEEFPFKFGDKVIALSDNKPYKIIVLEHYNGKLCYKLDNGFHYQPRALKPYKEMKEERNITLTLDKAKEWYKKGGELKEIALQAFTEKELNPLPRSWEEFCKQGNPIASWRYSIPTKYEALYQLEQLRNCWWGDWEPDWCDNIAKYAIKKRIDKSTIERIYVTHAFLSFPTYELALEFRECFRDLIEKAGDLI